MPLRGRGVDGSPDPKLVEAAEAEQAWAVPERVA